MSDVHDKVAFITGAAGGIGLGIARALASAGARVVLTDLDSAELAVAADDLTSTGAEVMALTLDVTDRDGWSRCAQHVRSEWGPVQLLVNNAGVSTLGMPFGGITPGLWDRVIGINLTGTFNGVNCFLDGMRSAGSGHIVNVSSMAGLEGAPLLAPYVTSKFAIVGLSEALAAEFANTAVGVSVVCPGQVRSRLWRTSRGVRGLPDTDVPPDDFTGSSARATMTSDEVGRLVLQAVLADEFYVMTHAQFREAVAARHQRLLHAFDVCAALSSTDGS